MSTVTTMPIRRRATFHPLTVRKVRRLTPDSVEVTFDVPDELAEEYRYAPGQYVALRATLDGREVRRSYSICTDPVPGELRVAIKRDIGGFFSVWANDHLAAGDVLEVMSPQGTFTTQVSPSSTRHYAAIAAGSGITPVMALISSVLKSAPRARFTLVYANRTARSIMFLEEIADLKDRFPARFAVHHVLSREEREAPIFSGRIDADRLQQLLTHVVRPADVDEWFLCGPFALVQLCRDTLNVAGVPGSVIHQELFSTGTPMHPVRERGRPTPEPHGSTREIVFTLDGRRSSVRTAADGDETILNAALRARADVPFACAGGVCGTCRATLVSGTVDMAENYALEKDELDLGYILTCQSRPTSQCVTVNYDS